MKNILLILVLAITLLVLFLGCAKIEDPPFPSDGSEIFACEINSDCVLIEDCCSCSYGGSNIAINKKYLNSDNLVKYKEFKCGEDNPICLTVISGDSSCIGNVTATCTNKKCQVVPDSKFS
jgi:hypothetical protein